jgi:hypothetical protein
MVLWDAVAGSLLGRLWSAKGLSGAEMNAASLVLGLGRFRRMLDALNGKGRPPAKESR